MAGNIKAGIMATTTMVGSAWAYTKASNDSGAGGSHVTDGGRSGAGGGGQGHGQYQHHGHHHAGGGCLGTQHGKYQDTVQQMMHWKY